MPTSAALCLVLSNNHLFTKLVATMMGVEGPFWVSILDMVASYFVP
jgi:hypothetical protein